MFSSLVLSMDNGISWFYDKCIWSLYKLPPSFPAFVSTPLGTFTNHTRVLQLVSSDASRFPGLLPLLRMGTILCIANIYLHLFSVIHHVMQASFWGIFKIFILPNSKYHSTFVWYHSFMYTYFHSFNLGVKVMFSQWLPCTSSVKLNLAWDVTLNHSSILWLNVTIKITWLRFSFFLLHVWTWPAFFYSYSAHERGK